MTTIRDILRDADPLRHEPLVLDTRRDRLRQSLIAAVLGSTSASASRRTSLLLLATVVLTVVSVIAVGSRMWSEGGATLQAAIRFEVRLAEDQPIAGLREA